MGQPVSTESYSDQDYFGEQLGWFSPDRIALSVDEDKVDDKVRMTLVPILRSAKNLKKGEIIELMTSFVPAPGIKILRGKGYAQQHDLPISYPAYRYFVRQDPELLNLWQAQRQ